MDVNAKIRYRQSDQPCIIDKKEGYYTVNFIKPQRAIAPGQICAIYS